MQDKDGDRAIHHAIFCDKGNYLFWQKYWDKNIVDVKVVFDAKMVWF